MRQKKKLFEIPMKCDHHRDFSAQIDWKHFHRWMKKTGNDNAKSNQMGLYKSAACNGL